jgi:hypothetical protein
MRAVVHASGFTPEVQAMVLQIIADQEDLRSEVEDLRAETADHRAEIAELRAEIAELRSRCVDRSEVATMIDERVPRTADEWLACLGGCVLAEAVPEMPRAHVGSGRS